MKPASQMKGHRDLEAWQAAMSFVRAIYLVTRQLPKEELYGLASQLRRAAVSIPSNLAEGYGRKSRREFRRFIGDSIGSFLEVETQIEIARDVGFINEMTAADVLHEAHRLTQLLNGLRSWTERKIDAEL
jgi:four helix bundle protein